MKTYISSIKSSYKKLIALLLAAIFIFASPLTVIAQSSNQTIAEELGYQAKQRTLIRKNEDIYVRIKKSEFEEIERQAFLSTSLLQRIRDLEKLYRQIKEIIETANAAIEFIKSFLNIDELDIFPDSDSDNEFEHISGVIMSPGFVEFTVTTTDPELNFDDIVTSNFLEFDLYYNKNLFSIDHIEGKGVFGDQYSQIALPQETSSAKDRIKLPLSDVLTNTVSFKVYLAPLDHETIEVGDKTSLDIRYYKRVPLNDDDERIPPLQYQFSEDSATEIVVTVV